MGRSKVDKRERGGLTTRAVAAFLTIALGASVPLSSSPANAATFAPPPVRHVWVIMLENSGYATNFTDGSSDPYLSRVAVTQGVTIPNYYGIGHESLDNYIAYVSGQAPNPQTQDDCASRTEFTDSGAAAFGQHAGQGCVFTPNVQTFFNQLTDADFEWKSYQEDLGNSPARDGGTTCPTGNPSNYTDTSEYVTKHDPTVWFHAVIDKNNRAYCLARDVPLGGIKTDLQQVSTTPNFSFITPNLNDDGHDGNLMHFGDVWLRQWLPVILGSPAYRKDGMVVITFDESEGLGVMPQDSLSCCNEIPGPNSPDPGITGPGGGQTGTLILSPYATPDSVDDQQSYNHYSALRSLEDLFGISGGADDGHGHLGYAGTYTGYDGPGSFGPDVYNACPASGCDQTASALVPQGSTGPRISDGSSSWENPTTTANNLTGVSCLDALRCVAVGRVGTILQTSDGGAHWSIRPSGTTNDLNAISCAGTSNCYAVGGQGTVLKSADAGATWLPLGSGTGSSLNGIACADASTCYAVGNGGTVRATSNGGFLWSGPSGSGTTKDLYGVSCPSTTTCFASGVGMVTKTTDGTTWTATPPLSSGPDRFHSIRCVSTTRCITVGDESWVFTTADGGATWTQKANHYHDQHTISSTLAGVDCTAADSCMYVGDYDPGGVVASYGEGATIAFTGDFGTNVFRLAARDNNGLKSVTCVPPAPGQSSTPSASPMPGSSPTSTPGLAPTSSSSASPSPSPASAPRAPTACYAVGDYGTILHTDSGAHWTAQSFTATPRQTPVKSWEVPAPATIHGIACPDSETCFAVGDETTILRRNGSSWARQDAVVPQLPGVPASPTPSPSPSPSDPDQETGLQRPEPAKPVQPTSLFGVSCPGPSTCYAVGSYGVVLKTSDGGATHWTSPGPISGHVEALYGISCPDVSTCFAVGSNNNFEKTTNGGGTWFPLTSPPSRIAYGTLDAVSCTDTTHCVAVGSGGTVLRTTDGNNLMEASSGTSALLTGLSCPGTDECFASGEAGTLLRSTDFGGTWTEVNTGVGEDLGAISCSSSSECLVAGTDGAILSTSDAGSTWSVHGTGTRSALGAVSCPATGACYEGGSGGTILGPLSGQTPSATSSPSPAPSLTPSPSRRPSPSASASPSPSPHPTATPTPGDGGHGHKGRRPLVRLHVRPRRPRNRHRVRFTILLRACRKRSARTELAGTRVKLQRRRGGRKFKTIATKKVGLRCAVRLRLKTRRGAVHYRAIWPKQNRTFRRGHSPVVTVTRSH